METSDIDSIKQCIKEAIDSAENYWELQAILKVWEGVLEQKVHQENKEILKGLR